MYYFAIFAIVNEKLITKDHRLFVQKRVARCYDRPAVLIVRRARSCFLQTSTQTACGRSPTVRII